MFTKPNTITTQLNETTSVATNVAAVVTLAADADQTHVLDALYYSYDAAPTGGLLTVTIGGTTVFEVDVTAGGPDDFEFPNGLYNDAKNEEMVVTLAAAGGSIQGIVTVSYR